MKMSGLFFGSLFWGILICLIGLSIIFKYVFNIDLHLVRIFLGIIIVLFGVKLIIGYSAKHRIRESIITPSNKSQEYNMIFTGGTIDLTNLDIQKLNDMEINIIFGSAKILFPDTVSLDVESTTVFGATVLPNRSIGGISSETFVFNENVSKPKLHLETNVIFGRLEFEVIQTGSASKESGSQDKSSY